jgi:hypothetical protein
MNLIRFVRRLALTSIMILLMAGSVLSGTIDEPKYLGKPLDYWLQVLHDRNDEMISLAFDAIRGLGPQARAAVPELTALVAAPFTPIRIGKDSPKVIARKLYDIEVRAGAIDALSAIGESASSASAPLVAWALTPRVIPEAIRNSDDEELFIELVMMDTEQRMRIAHAVGELGPDASEIIASLVSSPDPIRRKFGVAILDEGALPIASKLLRSRKCDDRVLGLTILKDMDLVVARPYLDWLQNRTMCETN